MSLTSEDVFEALRVVEDPELGMDVVDLGLVYEVKVDGDAVAVIYSLTSMGCPAGAQIEQDIKDAVGSMEGVGHGHDRADLLAAVVAGAHVRRRQVRPRLLALQSPRCPLRAAQPAAHGAAGSMIAAAAKILARSPSTNGHRP